MSTTIQVESPAFKMARVEAAWRSDQVAVDASLSHAHALLRQPQPDTVQVDAAITSASCAACDATSTVMEGLTDSDATAAAAAAVAACRAAGVPAHITHALLTLFQSDLNPASPPVCVYSTQRHAGTAAAWHDCVDGKPRLITLLCTGEHWFGGYTHLGFGGAPGFKSDPRACLFTLTNPHGIAPMRYAVKSGGEKAIYQQAELGPFFGQGDLDVQAPFGTSTRNYSYFPWGYADSTHKGCDTFTDAGWVRSDDWGPHRVGWAVDALFSFTM